MEFSSEHVVQALVWIVAGAIIARFTVEALRKNGTLEERNAGQLNQVVSFVVAAGLLALRHFGYIDAAVEAETLGNELAVALITWPVIYILAYAIHKLTKRAEGRAPDAGGSKSAVRA